MQCTRSFYSNHEYNFIIEQKYTTIQLYTIPTRESGAPHEVVDGLTVDGEAGSAIRHDALALGTADLGTQVGLGGLAEDTGGLSVERELDVQWYIHCGGEDYGVYIL